MSPQDFLLAPALLLFLSILASAVKPSPTRCQQKDGSFAPCGPGNDHCHVPGYGTTQAPQFHVRDASCAMNDPAAVSYDPQHAVYHSHWEAHLAKPGGQYARGHAISRDLVHWAHLPVSLWNDRPYDNYAIFTGSSTVVNGTTIQIYPGLCRSPKPGTACPGATNLAIAVPANPADPTQKNWTKDGVLGSFTGYTNPIANDTGRDPSSAWRTPAGEWRIVSYGSVIYGSANFKSWTKIGTQRDFPLGECPSFFPLPFATTTTTTPSSSSAGTPTHVYKTSHGGKDWMVVGTYAAGAPGRLGSFTATGDQVVIDRGAFYASKDFYDPVGRRRILFGWAQIAYGPWNDGQPWESSHHTLPRQVTWNPDLEQLEFAPLTPELQRLRGEAIGAVKSRMLPANNQPVSVLGANASAGRQSELVVTFKRPDRAVTLTVEVMIPANSTANTELTANTTRSSGSSGGGVEFTISYKPPAAAEVAAAESGAAGAPTSTASDPRSFAEVQVGCPVIKATDTLRLLPAEDTIEVRVFVDNVVAEVYWQGGRVVMTVPTRSTCSGPSCAADMTIRADQSGITLVSADAWAMGSIWQSVEEVLAKPRPDGGRVELMTRRIDAQQLLQ